MPRLRASNGQRLHLSLDTQHFDLGSLTFPLPLLFFDTSGTLLISLTGPGGLGKEMELEKERHYETFRLHLGPPGLVPGRWRLTARQPGASAELDFTVQRATEARVWVERQFNGRTREAGAGIPYFLGGFPPGRTISLDLYQAEGRGYLTSFPVPIDGNGEAHGVLATDPDDKPGCYGISHPLLYAPGRDPINFAVFCLERPG